MPKPPSRPAPATFWAAVRYLLAILLPIAVHKGWLGESDAASISALAALGATVGYGLWKTHDRQKRLSADATSRVR